jgi:hypothetical protein
MASPPQNSYLLVISLVPSLSPYTDCNFHKYTQVKIIRNEHISILKILLGFPVYPTYYGAYCHV